MNKFLKIAAIASLTAVAACGGSGDDSLGDNVAQAYENQADMVDEMADNATNEMQEDALENQAEALRDTGEMKEEAIDDADVNSPAVANAM